MSVALYSCYGMNIMHHFFNLQVAICVDPLINLGFKHPAKI